MNHRRWLWLTITGLVAATLLTAAAGTLAWVGSLTAGYQSLANSDPYQAEQHFSGAMSVPITPWLAPFDRGVARYAQEQWDAAAEDFELAASKAPIERDCMIRLNWSAALERSADALVGADDAASASARYQQALVVLTTAMCPDDELAASRQSQSEAQSQSRERLAGKLGAMPPSQSPEQSEPQPGDDQKFDQLDERSQQAQQERQLAEQRADPRTGGTGTRTW